MAAPFLPTLNACLNASSLLFLALGWWAIKRRRIEVHKTLMLCAFACSALFLAGYLYYHAQVGSVRYQGQGAVRIVYFSILISHTILAAAVLPLALRVLFLAAKGRFEAHAWWARRTLPIWLYVSATGVVIYAMLYHRG